MKQLYKNYVPVRVITTKFFIKSGKMLLIILIINYMSPPSFRALELACLNISMTVLCISQFASFESAKSLRNQPLAMALHYMNVSLFIVTQFKFIICLTVYHAILNVNTGLQ